jgi:hypothetical protein
LPESRFPRAFLPIAVATLLAGCGGSTEPVVLRTCPDFPGSAGSADRFTFVLTEFVDPANAPVPTNDSEAILFGLAYPGLVLTDCEGGILPWAAASWDWSPSDSAWVFALDPGVTFADGVPLRAQDVQQMWMTRRDAAARIAPWIWDHVGSNQVSISRSGGVVIRSASGSADLLSALTQPSLAIGRPARTGWPIGTRGMIAPAADAGTPGGAEWLWRDDRRSKGAAEIAFRVMEGATPAAIVASGADAFFVRQRAAIDELGEMPGYRVTPYPYSRLYVLLTPDAGIVGKIGPEDLRKLLPLAVSDARVALGAEGYRSEVPIPKIPGPQTKDRIVVPWWDRDAQAIAKELSAIWRDVSDRGYPAILPKKRDEFFGQVLAGEDALYIFPVDPPLRSEDLQRLHLLRSAPWLAERGGSVPLIETRGHLVTREGLTGFGSGYEGIPRLDGAGWSRGPAVP